MKYFSPREKKTLHTVHGDPLSVCRFVNGKISLQAPPAGVQQGLITSSRVSFQGFGEPSGEFWLGNEFVSRMTVQQSYKLRIQLSDWEGNSGFSQYDQFSLDSEAQNYRYSELTTSKK